MDDILFIFIRLGSVQTKIVLQIFCRHTKLHVKAICGQAMDTQSVDDLDGQRLICRFREGTVDDVLQLLAGIHHTADGHVALQEAV